MQFSCDSSNPLIGDLNLNGIPYEAADAAIFADYFVHREQAFSISVDSQMNATDINGDGGPGTISDYIYLSAILSGEMTPGQSIPPGSTGSLFNLIDSGTTVILSGRFRIPVGGIELWLYASDPASDNISLMPFDDGMDLDYARSGNYLRVLIHTDMTLGYPRDYIDSGYGEILKISYTNTKPILLFASAAGFSGENIQLNYPYPGQIDYRGDVNLNGIPNEVGDAVVFANYLLFGLCAFIINEQGQTEASDVDGDGVPLTVQDYAYLCGIMKGIFQPLPKGEAKSDGALIFVETDSSIIMSGAFSDSISVLYMKFYASGLSSSDQFRYHVLPGVDSMKVSYTSPFYLCLGDTFNILISPSLYPESGMVTINPGSAGLLEILTNVVKPEFISAAAAGRHAEFVNVSISAENNYPPYFPSYPGNLGNDYNGMFNHVFVAADSNLLPDRISYGIISGPGEINTVTGEWKFSPICAKVGDTFSLVICASDILHPCPQPDTNLYARVQLTITNPPPMLGDADNNGALNILDITYLINFIYRHGTPPMATAGIGDLNADGKVNILDLTYFINHLFKNGPAPICP